MYTGFSTASFHELLQRSLSGQSSSKPPKIEVSGLLVPTLSLISGQVVRFKLETNHREYFLSMNKNLEKIAKRVECEQVTVKGCFDLETQLFEVEKIFISRADSLVGIGSVPEALTWDDNFYKRTIAKFGKLEPAVEHLAS